MVGEHGELPAASAPQMSAVRSKEAVTMRRPSGENAALRTTLAMAGEDGELRARLRVPDARGLVLAGGNDAPPVGRERGADTTEVAGPWPEKTASGLPVSASQMRAVPSMEAVTMRRPSGENAGDRTESS